MFVAVVLIVGLTLVYLSFARVTAITRAAASSFIEKAAQLSADHIDEKFKTVRDNLGVLAGLPSIQAAGIADNPRLYAVLASMLRNNPQLFNLYVGYDDGSFLEMDVIDRAQPAFRESLAVDDSAAFRLVVIAPGAPSRTTFLSEALVAVAERAGPADYDPRLRPWYVEGLGNNQTLLTGPYIFYATGEPGYTLRMPLRQGRAGVIAADVLLNRFEEMLAEQRLGESGLTFLFNDVGRIVGHPDMRRLMKDRSGPGNDLPALDAIGLPGLVAAVHAWRGGAPAQQFFAGPGGRTYAVAFHPIKTTGEADVRLAVMAPPDEFFSRIIAERRALFALAIAFVGATLPFAFWLGSLMARPLRKLARETDEIQRFEIAERPRVHSVIAEIEELGRSVFTMRSVVRSFASFIPRQIVRQLIQSGSSLSLGGTRREITVMFTDVADFTAKTERADPSRVMIYTSRYFAALSSIIMDHHGTIDKFIGDAVMAFWNAPADDPDHVRHACRSALACVDRSAELNETFAAEGWPPYETRFGLHTGDAVVGNIGSSDRMNYTALGATINLAARLEQLNKSYGTQMLVSEAVKERAEPDFVFRKVDRIRPKGFAQAVTIFELRCERTGDVAAEFAFCQRWDDIDRLLEEDRPTAVADIAAFLRQYPGDGVAQFHVRRLSAASESTMDHQPESRSSRGDLPVHRRQA